MTIGREDIPFSINFPYPSQLPSSLQSQSEEERTQDTTKSGKERSKSDEKTGDEVAQADDEGGELDSKEWLKGKVDLAEIQSAENGADGWVQLLKEWEEESGEDDGAAVELAEDVAWEISQSWLACLALVVGLVSTVDLGLSLLNDGGDLVDFNDG